ncbi:MAG: hypothetical protein AAGI34_11550 [Pseudomonadota bacterium]
MSSTKLLAAVAAVSLMPHAAFGVSLTYVESFVASADVQVLDDATGNLFNLNVDPDGIAFNPTTGTVFFTDNNQLVEAQTDGTVLNVFELEGVLFNTASGATEDAEGLTLLPNGNLLVGIDFNDFSGPTPDQSGDRLVEYTVTGQIVPGGINVTLDAAGAPVDADGSREVSSVVLGPSSAFVGSDTSQQIFEIDLGTPSLLNVLEYETIVGGDDEPEGLAIDPFTGNLLVADDDTGNGVIYEITPDGTFVEAFSLDPLAALLGIDFSPSSLAIDPATNRLFLGNIDENRIDVFQINDPTAIIPIGPTAPLLLSAIAAPFLLRRRRRTA